ncbi:MAG: DUF167 domain-containing protein [Patescibacteria group bacterium]
MQTKKPNSGLFCYYKNMRITVRAKASAKKPGVEKVSSPAISLFGTRTEPDIYKVSVKEAPVDGRANQAIIRALSEYFDVAPSCVHLVSGQSAKRKVFEIDQ